MKASEVIDMLETLIDMCGDIEIVFSAEAGGPIPADEKEEPEVKPFNRIFGQNGKDYR